MAAGGVELWLDGEALDDPNVWLAASVAYGHFTSMQLRGGAVRGLAAHLGRIDAAHRELFDHGLDRARAQAEWAVAARARPDASLRAAYYDDSAGRTHALLRLTPPVAPAPNAQRLESVHAVRAFAHLKHLGTFAQIALGRAAEHHGYDDALLVADDGLIAETTIANIGFVRGSAVVWPSGPALHGIGQQLLEVALPAAGIPWTRERVRLGGIARFDAAFTVNSIGVVPVVRIDAHEYAASGMELVDAVVAVHDAVPWTPLAAGR